MNYWCNNNDPNSPDYPYLDMTDEEIEELEDEQGEYFVEPEDEITDDWEADAAAQENWDYYFGGGR